MGWNGTFSLGRRSSYLTGYVRLPRRPVLEPAVELRRSRAAGRLRADQQTSTAELVAGPQIIDL
jgi:hypothetical protein